MRPVRLKPRFALVAVALGTVAGPLPAQTESQTAPPPIAKTVDTVDQIYGRSLSDPYRWMEGPDNPEFRSWLKAQGDAGRTLLDASPAMQKWQTRLGTASGAVVTNSAHHRVGNRVFYLHLDEGRQGALHVRLEDGSDRTLFDPNTLTGSAHASITGYSVSPDGRRVALNLDRGGQEITSIEFFSVDSGQRLPDTLDHIWGEFQAQWLGNDAVIYTQMAPATGQTDAMLNMRARYHKLGMDTAADPVVAGREVSASVSMAPQEFPFVVTDPSSRWALLVIGGARAEQRLCIAKTDQVTAAAPDFTCLIGYDDEISNFAFAGDTLYLLSLKGAPNGRMLALNLAKPGVSLTDARPVLAEDKDWIINGVVTARDGLYIKRMRLGVDGFVRIGTDGRTRTLTMPYDGSSGLVDADTQRDGLLFSLQGWTRPKRVFAYDPASDRLSDLKLGTSSPRDYSTLVEAETGEAKSLDGTLVPITILKPKGYKPDPHTLAIVLAYGAYGLTITQPSFDPLSLEWVADGHLYVYAGIRGGGEKGDTWRLAGKGPDKHHSIEDFVAAADALSARGYSDPKHIALYSASAGGIIVGGAIDRFPSHFGAAISHAGMLNPTRLAADGNGANQYAEFGDPDTEAGFKSLYDMDAYVNLKPGVAYPAVMLDVGLNDNRVAPWNSGKYGAKLRADNTGSSPVLFRTDGDAGHFGTSLGQKASEDADHFTFVEMTLGK